jgi:hypothetical protein
MILRLNVTKKVSKMVTQQGTPWPWGWPASHPMAWGWPRCMATPDGLVVLAATLILFFVLVFCFHLKFLHFS